MTAQHRATGKKRGTPKERVLKRWPKAHMNTAGYIQVSDKNNTWATVIGKSWADAARRLK